MAAMLKQPARLDATTLPLAWEALIHLLNNPENQGKKKELKSNLQLQWSTTQRVLLQDSVYGEASLNMFRVIVQLLMNDDPEDDEGDLDLDLNLVNCLIPDNAGYTGHQVMALLLKNNLIMVDRNIIIVPCTDLAELISDENIKNPQPLAPHLIALIKNTCPITEYTEAQGQGPRQKTLQKLAMDVIETSGVASLNCFFIKIKSSS